MSDLSLVGTEDLVTEITSRFDVAVIGLSNYHDKADQSDCLLFEKGGLMAAMGLASWLKIKTEERAHSHGTEDRGILG